MKAVEVMRQAISQAEFGAWVGISEARVSQLMSEGVLTRGESGHEWLIAYCERLRDMAAGRASSQIGSLDLVQERAALAREQRIAIELKNEIARGEYAHVHILTEVFAIGSQAISERHEQLSGTLRKVCPELPDAARDVVMATIADSRNVWVAATCTQVIEALLKAHNNRESRLESNLDLDDHHHRDEEAAA